MKPLNLDNRPCSPISSNCVIWQGPDIPCINLCTGDTVSDVVFKLATELCAIMDTLKITNYDLSCFNLAACPPQDFQELIQFLINKICELEGVTPGTDGGKSTCPDCVVNVASCFVVGTQTTMQLVDYVLMIGQKVCALVNEIIDLQNQINNLDIRVTALESAPPPTFTLPSIATNCLQSYIPTSPAAATINLVLNALVNDGTIGYCALIGATGEPAEISAAVQSQLLCLTDLSQPLAALPTITTFSAYYAGTWVQDGDLNTAAEAINNLWIALCDIRAYVSTLSLNITTVNTSSVNLDYTAGTLTAHVQDTGWEPLEGFDHYDGSVEKPQCRRIGNVIHFRGVAVVPLATPGSPSIVEVYTSTSYNAVVGCQTFSGAGGCFINTDGSITFNNNNSVIDASILDVGTNLDNTYSTGYIVGARPINLDGTYGTALTAALNVVITSDKKLRIGVLKDLELTLTRINAGNLGSSHLRYITSNVTSGEYVPNFINAASTVHSSPNTGLTNTVALPAPLAPDTQYLNNLNTNYNTFTYPFSCDAGDESQIGGFTVRLDGLIAYVDPCTTDIKNYSCP